MLLRVLRSPLLLLSIALLWSAPSVVQASAESAVPVAVSVPASADQRIVLSLRSAAGSRSFTLAELERLGMYRVRTSTFWPGDEGVFEGPLLATVLGEAGMADVDAVRITALDGFTQTLPATDWRRWPVMLATRHHGQPMGVRDKGPLRIVYPRDMDAELREPGYRLRWVWVVNAIEAIER